MRPDRRLFLAAALAAPFLARPALAAETQLKLRELYNKDRSFSDLAQELQGQRITVPGFMAPPLKAESRFFVLTKMPMSYCPFCESEAEWPDDILAIYTKRIVDVVPFNVNITTRGVLELGSFKDPETGFVSMIRLTDASYA
ncbi:hypothetical protein [Poseidonocella sp. HB161398]|uniref:hypothetical protein n=1 Tax=Poseidonocella sp. HB161398 TaxID=2320855 RepID=UPI001109E64A|nr:hypothetical protein [Poseidonocella sp. HB161398]